MRPTDLTGTVMRRWLLTLLTVLGLATLTGALAAPAEVNVSAELRTAHDLVAQSLREYAAGQREAAFKTARSAYLDHFEYAEPTLRVLNPDLILEMEYRFADLRGGMQSGAPMSELQRVAGDIDESLRKADGLVNGTGVLAPTLAATGGFTILFREGLEAALLIAAIVAYLASTRNDRLRAGVWWGALAALAATAATWFVATYLLAVAPISRELISAITSAVAVVILFYLSFWMLRQGDRKRGAEFMRARVSQAVQSGSLGAVALVTFTAIYREGFETVLFYQALAVASGPVAGYMYLGLGLAVLALIAVFGVLLGLGKRVPTARLFPVLVGVTALFAVAFVGNGLRAFQEAGWLPVTNLYGLFGPLNPNVAALTGLHPTLETLLGQLLLALVYVFGFVLLRVRTGSARREARG